jgi:hypothetical protein
MIMDLAKAFDAKLQATILSVGNVAAVRNDLSKRLAETISVLHPEVPVLVVIKVADQIIGMLLAGTIEHCKVSMTPAEWGDRLANPSIQQKLYDSGIEFFTKAVAQVRYERRIAEGAEFARSNTAQKEGVAIDGVVYER